MRLINFNQLKDPFLVARDSTAIRYVNDCIEASGIEAIHNVETGMLLLDTGTYQFPVSLNKGDERTDNSYVVSPLTTYTVYAKDELTRMRWPWLTWPLVWLINGIGILLKAAQIDKLVQVNNWLLSTNLYPSNWCGADIPEITNLLVTTYPEHAIAFRSLNHFSNAVLFKRLRLLGFVPVPSRQVYLFDARDGARASFLDHHNTRIDANFLSRTSYKIFHGHELSDKDFPRLEQLYNLLYLDKYCQLNPQFSADWLRCGQRDGWLQLRVLRTTEGRIDGVLGWFSNEQIMTAPIVGYDTALPKKLGLYRLLTQMCLQEAVSRQCLLNFSSGAAHFKRLRGGQPEIEYSMVYVQHLSTRRRLVWSLLSCLLCKIGVPMMRSFKL